MPTSHIRFNNTMIDPVGELVGNPSTCTWCVDDNDILETSETLVTDSLR